jgi:hypothetical protein
MNAAGNHGRHDPPGGNHPRSDAVRGDPERPEILGQIPRVISDSGLRCPVMGIAAIGGRCGSSRIAAASSPGQRRCSYNTPSRTGSSPSQAVRAPDRGC